MASTATKSRTSRAGNNGQDPARDLEAEIAALREDIAAITATLGDIARYRADEAQTKVHKVKRKVANTGEQALESVQENLELAEGELKNVIRDKPISSVLIAAGVGFLLSRIL